MKNLALDPKFAAVVSELRRLLKEWYAQNNASLDARYVVPEN